MQCLNLAEISKQYVISQKKGCADVEMVNDAEFEEFEAELEERPPIGIGIGIGIGI